MIKDISPQSHTRELRECIYTMCCFMLASASPKHTQLGPSTLRKCQHTMQLLQCRWENGLMHIPPMETSFGHWNTLLLLQDENPIIGRIFAGNPNIRFLRCLPNRDVISSLNPPNSHDPNGGTYVRIGGLLKEK